MNLTPVGDPAVYAELARRVRAVEPEPPVPLPEPEVRWRDAEPDELCKSALSLARKARAAGWGVAEKYARGPYIGAKGESLGTAEANTLLFRWDRWTEAFAHWYRRDGGDWKLEGAWLLAPMIRLGGNDIGHWLASTGPATKKEAA